ARADVSAARWLTESLVSILLPLGGCTVRNGLLNGFLSSALAACMLLGVLIGAAPGNAGAAAANGAETPTAVPTTYCNPISLPDYPIGKRARDVTVGLPVPADDSLWLVDKQQQFRELADVTVVWYEGA